MKRLLLYRRGLFVLPVVAGLAACAPVRLAAGSYSETRGPGVVMWEGKELRLADDHTFWYSYWSDDISSGRYGTGTYRMVGKKLTLGFTAQPAGIPEAITRPLVAGADSLVLTFTVAGRGAYGSAPATALPGATVIAYGAANQALAATSTDAQGRAVLRLPRAARAQLLLVQSIGFVEWRQACPVGSTAYQLALPANAGTPYAAGTRQEFRVRRHTDTTLVLGQGLRITKLRRQPLAP